MGTMWFSLRQRFHLVPLCVFAVVACACRSNEPRVPPVEPTPGGVCVGVPPPVSQTSVRVVMATTGEFVVGAHISFMEFHAVTDERGEVRVPARALRSGVTARIPGFSGTWREDAIPELVTVELSPDLD